MTYSVRPRATTFFNGDQSPVPDRQFSGVSLGWDLLESRRGEHGAKDVVIVTGELRDVAHFLTLICDVANRPFPVGLFIRNYEFIPGQGILHLLVGGVVLKFVDRCGELSNHVAQIALAWRINF